MNKEIKVYYNSACPVCHAGILNQKRKTTECQVQWKDIHTDIESRKDISANVEIIREQLHIIDENGQIKVGIDAFEVLWRNSPREHWKAKIIALPIINQIIKIGYFIFARFLYKWNRSKHHW